MRVEKVTITPELARKLMGDLAENQRRIREVKVQQYARDMLAGDWPVTGDTIKVDTNGKLIDGQHRVAAVALANIAVEMFVAYDVDPAVMPMLDTGLGRKFGDVLHIDGTPQRLLTGAIVRYICSWEAGNRMGTTGYGRPAPTHSEMLARFKQDADLFSAASQRGGDVQRSKLTPGGPAGTAFFLFMKASDPGTDYAHRFFDSFLIGANLELGDPILALRNRVTRARTERLKSAEYLALYVRTWNALAEERRLETVPIVTGGRTLSNATFPLPKRRPPASETE